MPKVDFKCHVCGEVKKMFPSDARRMKTCSKHCAMAGGLFKKNLTTHGESYTRLHGIWCHMKTRCKCPTAQAYSYYGGRGISVCKEWDESFVVFRDWANSNGYTEQLELDRADVNGNYEPGNCRWATRTQQMANTRKRRDAKTSMYKGVSWRTKEKRWVAQVHSNGKTKVLGIFKTEVEAAQAYDVKAKELWGEFSNTNF